MVLSYKASTRQAAGLSDPGALELWDERPALRPREVLDRAAIWLFVRRNAVLIALVAGVVGILCLFALWLFFDQYSATALVLVDPRDAKATATQEVLANIGPDSIAVESVVQIAKSDGFLGALVDQQGLAKDPEFNRGAEDAETQRAAAAEKLKAKLSVARRGATYVIDVTMKTREPQKSARLANAVAKTIVDNQSQLRTGSDQRAIDFIGAKLADLRARVNNEETAVATLKAALQITDAGQGEVLQERRITELNQQFVLAKAHTQETRARVDQLRKANANDAAELPSAPAATVLNALRQDYARLTRQAAEKETVLGERHPDVAVLRAEIVDAKKQIAAEEARLIASARNDYVEARQREAGLAEELRKAQVDSGAGDQNLVRLRQAERDAKADRDVYDQLLTRQRELIESAGFAPIDVRIASPASPPLRATTPGWPIMLAASSLFGLFAGMAAAAAREARLGSLATSAEIERIVGAPVAGIVPFLSPPPSVDGVSAEGAAARWFADLCAAALMKLALRRGLLLVTSSRTGEGASTIAANIAGHWAGEGLEVLLVQLGATGRETNPRAGVIEVLAGEALLQDAILWRGAGQARLLTLGAEPASRDETTGLDAAAPRLHALLRRCRRRFDMVIVDAPAASTSAIPRRFAPGAASLLVVEWDADEAAQVAATVARLESQSIGIVLNKVDLTRYAAFESNRAPWRSAA
jgi:succinoglycan biosynthesis transport protein ExoP